MFCPLDRGSEAPAKALCSLLVPTQLCCLAKHRKIILDTPPSRGVDSPAGVFINSLIKTRIYCPKIKEFYFCGCCKGHFSLTVSCKDLHPGSSKTCGLWIFINSNFVLSNETKHHKTRSSSPRAHQIQPNSMFGSADTPPADNGASSTANTPILLPTLFFYLFYQHSCDIPWIWGEPAHPSQCS